MGIYPPQEMVWLADIGIGHVLSQLKTDASVDLLKALLKSLFVKRTEACF
jgi:hypothetical protein